MEQGRKKKEMRDDKLVVKGGVVTSQPALYTCSWVGARVGMEGQSAYNGGADRNAKLGATPAGGMQRP